MEAILNLIKSNEEEILNLSKKIELLKEQNEKLNKIIDQVNYCTTVRMHNYNYFVDDLVFVDRKINITDLPDALKAKAILDEKQNVKDCKIAIGENGSFIEFKVTQDYGMHNIQRFKKTYNDFINDRVSVM